MRSFFATALALSALLLLASPATVSADTQCPSCQRHFDNGFKFCPYDGGTLEVAACTRCQQAMEPTWRFCPFDGTSLGSGQGGTAAAASPRSTPNAEGSSAASEAIPAGAFADPAGTAIE
ncbi:MAG: zinc ribbon domain-containing protein, partial [Planctomycetota bacterium]